MINFRYILSHSIFVAFCAAALGLQTFQLLQIPFSLLILGLLFFSTLAAYNFYWMLSKFFFCSQNQLPIRLKDFVSHFIFFIGSSIVVMDCVWQQPQMLTPVFGASIFTFIYAVLFSQNNRKQENKFLLVFKSVLLALTWSYITVYLPAIGFQSESQSALPNLFLHRFLFMWMLCIIFESKDIFANQSDESGNVSSQKSNIFLVVLMTIVLLTYAIHLLLTQQYFGGLKAVVLMGTGALTYLIFLLSLKPRSYYFYYFLVDGLMIFSSIATYIASI